MEDSISLLERTSMKLLPIVREVLKRMIDEGSSAEKEHTEKIL